MQSRNSTSSLNNSRGGGNGHLGMTAPISWAGPDKSDEERTKILIEALQPHGCYETPEELGHRMEVRPISYSSCASRFMLKFFDYKYIKGLKED